MARKPSAPGPKTSPAVRARARRAKAAARTYRASAPEAQVETPIETPPTPALEAPPTEAAVNPPRRRRAAAAPQAATAAPPAVRRPRTPKASQPVEAASPSQAKALPRRRANPKTPAQAAAPTPRGRRPKADASESVPPVDASSPPSPPSSRRGIKSAAAAPMPLRRSAAPTVSATSELPPASPKPRVRRQPTSRVEAAQEAVAPPAAEAPKPPPAGADRGSAASAMDPLAFLNSEQRQALEALSQNLARASLTAQGAVTEALVRRGDPHGAAADPFHVGPALQEVVGKLVMNPEKIMRAQADLFGQYLDLWTQSARRASGETVSPVASPAKGDKRFNDPDWTDNPVFDVMKQSYLLTSNWLNGLVTQVEDVDPLSKRRVEFFTKMLTDAFSPSNFLASNPAALREAVQSQGQSLVKGAQNFANDLQRGGGQLAISQTDAGKFKVGDNIATAPGKVVRRNELFELLQFNPTTETVFEVPLLIFPPWINKYYILDLRPENSMIRWLTSQGFTVFVTSWVNPDPQLAQKTLEDYMFGGIYTAVEQVLEQTGVSHVNTVGYCIGGTLLSCTLAHAAARNDRRIASATFFAAQQDFTEAGDLLLFTDDAWLKDLEERIDAAGGVSPAGAMASTFNSLRANDLIWSFFVNNYLMGKEPAAFDLLFWNSDQTQMPKALHLSYLTDFYKTNRLAKGELVLDNVRLDLSKVKVPIYVQSSKEDHIAPLRSVFRGAKLFGGPVTFTMAGSGHIAGVINHPDAKKYQHWTNTALPGSIEEWQSGAVEHPGSWWPDWKAWLSKLSGKMVAARDPSAGPFTPLGDAPGEYVKVRSTT